MENQFLVDSKFLSKDALEKKHRLENDPSARSDPEKFFPEMEKISSDIYEKVMGEVQRFDPLSYTEKDVFAALEHERCSIEDLKALLSPAAEPHLERLAERARSEAGKHFGNTVYLFTPL